ncbi:MAG: DNA repair protein RecO [Clostridia bacterium]|nr:DNA repair protein RecO [Clostridia bacterium]
MEIKSRAITLRAVNYKDNDRILTLITPEKGKISVSAKGVRKANAKMKVVSEPFCLSDCVFYERSGRLTLTEAEIVDTFFPIRENIWRFYAGTVALELANFLSQEDLEGTKLFSSLLTFLKDLCYGDRDEIGLLAEFIYRVLYDEGFAVDFSVCGRCGGNIEGRVRFNIKDGINVCENCAREGDREYSYRTYSFLKNIAEGEGATAQAQDGINALKFFDYYLRGAVGIQLKSIKFFTEK